VHRLHGLPGKRLLIACGSKDAAKSAIVKERLYSLVNNKSRSDNGFGPTASKDYDEITVQRVELARDSWWFFCVRRKRADGQYAIRAGGPHIGGAGKDVTPEEAAAYLLNRSQHWDTLTRLTKELGWDDVHRILVVVTKYGFVPMRLPIPES
jgi:hypothetical protein